MIYYTGISMARSLLILGPWLQLLSRRLLRLARSYEPWNVDQGANSVLSILHHIMFYMAIKLDLEPKN
jgi:hypothetical protein